MECDEVIRKTKAGELMWVCEAKNPNAVYKTFDKENVFVVKTHSGDDNSIVYILNGKECSNESGESLFRAIKRTRPFKKDNLVIIKNDPEKAKQKRKIKKPRIPYISIQEQELKKALKKARKRNKEIINRPISIAKAGKNDIEIPNIGYKDFVLRRSTFSCWNKNHHAIDITATVYVMSRNPEKADKMAVSVSAGYCSECNIYYIMESGYEKLKNLGIPMCRISDEKHYKKSQFGNGMKLSQESILMQYGYNVNQSEGLSERVRHKILASLIDNKVMTKSDIVSYLEFFISQRQSQPKYEVAISKWEEDKEFVNDYRIGDYNKLGIRGILRR